MNHLFRRLCRVADSSSDFYLLPSSPATQNSFRGISFQTLSFTARRSKTVPLGHLPVFVGDEMERFVVSAGLLHHPIFVKLLHKSAQEYGYEQEGVLRIPCNVTDFERLIDAIQIGADADQIEDLIAFV